MPGDQCLGLATGQSETEKELTWTTEAIVQLLCRELWPAVYLFAHFNHAFIATTAVFCVNNVFLLLKCLMAKFVICSLTSFSFIFDIILTTEYAEIYFISLYFSGTIIQY